MRKLVYLVGMTLDGRIAGPANEVDFFPLSDDLLAYLRSALPETLPTHVRDLMGVDAPNTRFDTVVMGRGTYQPALDVGITSPYAHLRQFVVSGTLEAIDDPEVTLERKDPLGLVRALKQEDGLDIWLAGGGQLAGQLLPELDEIVIKQYPVVVGAGVPAFDGAFLPTALTATSTREFSDGTRITTYRLNS